MNICRNVHCDMHKVLKSRVLLSSVMTHLLWPGIILLDLTTTTISSPNLGFLYRVPKLGYKYTYSRTDGNHAALQKEQHIDTTMGTKYNECLKAVDGTIQSILYTGELNITGRCFAGACSYCPVLAAGVASHRL